MTTAGTVVVVVLVVTAAGLDIASRITDVVTTTAASSVNSVDDAMFEVFFKVEDKLALP